MANTKELRMTISEEDTTVIFAICNALNALANPQAKNGFNFKVTQDRLSIYVYRARESFPAFEVSLKTSEIDESLLLTWNALFKKCIPNFEFDASSNQFIISLQENYTYVCENTSNPDSDISVEENETFVISLMKPFNELAPIVGLLNIVKIKKLLTISNNLLSISAIGRQITVSAQFNVVRQTENFKIPSFCSKFNYLHSLGLANFIFSVTTLASKTLLHISIIPPAKDDSHFAKYYEILEQFNSISSFVNKE